jgi:hypothetical protein
MKAMTEATGDNGAAAAAAATAATAAATAAAAAAPKWYAGADAATIGHLQSHGWDVKTPTEAALAAVQSHQAAAKLIGHPPEKVARIPEPNDEAGWKTFYEKLGAPTDPKQYDFSKVTFADPAQGDFVRAQAAALHLSQNAALTLAQNIIKDRATAAASVLADKTAALATEREALMKDWGADAEANLFVVRQTAAALGVSKEQVDALEKMDGMGYAKVMEMFRNIGSKIGEDKFVRNTSPNGAGVMSGEQAASRKAELLSDSAWTARYSGGDKAALREMVALNTILLAAGKSV